MLYESSNNNALYCMSRTCSVRFGGNLVFIVLTSRLDILSPNPDDKVHAPRKVKFWIRHWIQCLFISRLEYGSRFCSALRENNNENKKRKFTVWCNVHTIYLYLNNKYNLIDMHVQFLYISQSYNFLQVSIS